MSYDPETGEFAWLIKPRQRACPLIAGSINAAGYRQICIKGKFYYAHRLAWFYVHKAWPKDEIDHINRVRHDNRLKNLQDIPLAQNRRLKLQRTA